MSTRRSLFAFGLLLPMLALIASPAIAQPTDNVTSVEVTTPVSSTTFDRLTVKWDYAVAEMAVEADADLGFNIYYIKGAKAASGNATPEEELAAAERLQTSAAIDAAIVADRFADAGKPAKGPGSENDTTRFEYTVSGLDGDTLYGVAVIPYDGVTKAIKTTAPGEQETDALTTKLAPKPSRVRSLEVMPDDKSLMVEWQRPTNVGHSKLTLTGYEVRWRTSQTADDVAGTDIEMYPPSGSTMMLTDTEYEITGLINEVPYDVQVRGVNSARGKGDWYPTDWEMATPSEDAMPDDDDDDDGPKRTPALPLFGLLALFAGLVAAGRARLRR